MNTEFTGCTTEYENYKKPCYVTAGIVILVLACVSACIDTICTTQCGDEGAMCGGIVSAVIEDTPALIINMVVMGDKELTVWQVVSLIMSCVGILYALLVSAKVATEKSDKCAQTAVGVCALVYIVVFAIFLSLWGSRIVSSQAVGGNMVTINNKTIEVPLSIEGFDTQSSFSDCFNNKYEYKDNAFCRYDGEKGLINWNKGDDVRAQRALEQKVVCCL